MAKKKSRTSRASLGGRQKANLAHEAKRQEKFAKKRENGTAYIYKPNPYKEGSQEYLHEQLERQEKNKSSKLPYAQLKSFFAKLEYELAQEKLKAKESGRRGKKNEQRN